MSKTTSSVPSIKSIVAALDAVIDLINTILPSAAVVSPLAPELKASALLATGVTLKLL